jgi:hypothetical protein
MSRAVFDFPGKSDSEIVLDPENDGPKKRPPLDIMCDHCGEPLRVSRRWVGAVGFCGHCNEKFRVPLDAPEQPPESVAAYERAASLVKQDTEMCEAALLEAAKTRHPDAMYALGHLYLTGLPPMKALYRKGVRRDYERAREWFAKAADQGHGRAQLALGFIYYRGLDVQKDLARAFMWFTLAAQRGEENAEQGAKAMWKQMDEHEIDASKLMLERWYEAREN